MGGGEGRAGDVARPSNREGLLVGELSEEAYHEISLQLAERNLDKMVGVSGLGPAIPRTVLCVAANLLAAFLDIGKDNEPTVVGREDRALAP